MILAQIKTVFLIIRESIPCIILTYFTFYGLFIAVNSDAYGDRILQVSGLLTIIYLVSRWEKVFLRTVCVFVLAFGALAAASVYFPPSIYANKQWFFTAGYRLLLATLIIHAFVSLKAQQLSWIKYTGYFLVIFVFMVNLLEFLGFDLKNFVDKAEYITVSKIGWSDKYISFWIVFLMWVTLSLGVGLQGKSRKILSGVLIAMTGFSLFVLGSEVAVVAWLISTSVYLLLHIQGKISGIIYPWVLLGIFLSLPLLDVLLAATGNYNPETFVSRIHAFNRDTFHFIGSRGIHSIAARLHLSDISAHLVQENWLLGYGFGSTLNLPVSSAGFTSWKTLPGGHPHNVVFLFFIELGFFGFLLLASSVAGLFSFIGKMICQKNREGAPQALWAMLTAACIIFSTSFAIWQADMVMIYCMLFCLVLTGFSACNESWYAEKTGKETVKYVLPGISLLGIAGYITRNLWQ